MTVVWPVEDETDLVNLNNLSYNDLRPEFKWKAEVLKFKIFEDCPVKEMNGKALNGKILAGLLEQYVEAVNKGAVPNINTAWEGVVEEERQKCFEKAVSDYKTGLKRIELPAEPDIHLTALFLLRQRAFDILKWGFEFGTSELDKETETLKSQELNNYIKGVETDSLRANSV